MYELLGRSPKEDVTGMYPDKQFRVLVVQAISLPKSSTLKKLSAGSVRILFDLRNVRLGFSS